MEVPGEGQPMEFNLPPRTNEAGQGLIASAATSRGEWVEVNTHTWDYAEFCALTALFMVGVMRVHEQKTALLATDLGLVLNAALEDEDVDLSITVQPGGSKVEVSILENGELFHSFKERNAPNFFEVLHGIVYRWSELSSKSDD